MFCEWVDPVFVRYALLIIFVCTIVIVLTALHLFASCGGSEIPVARRSAASAQPFRPPHWLSITYVMTMFLCTCALLVFSDVLVGRLYAQTALVRRVLVNRFGNGHLLHENRVFWTGLQRTYECCGLHNASDWANSRVRLPESCCSPTGGGFGTAVPQTMWLAYANGGGGGHLANEAAYAPVLYGQDTASCTEANAYAMGCLSTMEQYVRTAAKWLSMMAFAFACIAMLGGFVACAAGYGLMAEPRVVPIRAATPQPSAPPRAATSTTGRNGRGTYGGAESMA